MRPSLQGAQPFESLPALRRPERSLLNYYFLSSLALGPFFLFALVPLYFRYRTLRYEIDDEGITMRRGILFHREVSLNYARIQDIHLSSNVVERWMGLAKIQVQTASGSAGAEMTIEGLHDYEAVRDFLYSKMRGAREHRIGKPSVGAAARSVQPTSVLSAGSAGELTDVLRELTAELRELRQILPAAGGREASDV